MSSLHVDVVTDDRTLAGLEGEWSRLLGATPLASGFQSLSWAVACRAALPAADTRLFALVVRDGGDPVGILPTELAPGGHLRFIGQGVSNYLGPVYRPERLDDVLDALGTLLDGDRRVMLIDFGGLREGSPFLDALRSRRVSGWSDARVVQTATCPYVELSPGWEAVYWRRKSKQRSNDARKWKALERFGQLDFVETARPEELRSALPTMFRLFEERWAGRHESGGFAGRYRSFHEHAAPALAAAGHLALSLLRLDGEIIAFSYGVRAGSVTSSYVLAHDNRLNVCSPGLLLLLRLLEAAAKRGDPEYDFSLGEESYKEAWATGTRGVFRVLRWRRRSTAGLKAWLHALGSRAWVAARSVGWLRAVRREGLRRVAFGSPAPTEAPDIPGLPAGDDGTWTVHRVARRTRGPEVAARAWTYREMTQHLSPRLLELAADRCFRGDSLLALSAGDRVLGVVWRADRARRELVTGKQDVRMEEAVYYHPVATPGNAVGDLVRAIAHIDDGAPGFIIVAQERLAGADLQHVGTFAGDHRFTVGESDRVASAG